MGTGHEFLVKRGGKRDVFDVVRMYVTGGVLGVCALPVLGIWA